jgi:hypothetical protein
MEDPAGFSGTLTYSPWTDVGERYPDWVVRRTDLRGLPELMCWDERVILLEESRSIAECRSDLAHAIGHLDLQHRGDTYNRKHEEAARRYAAKMLIDLKPLGEAMAWSSSREEVAELLRVDVPTLSKRLEHLHAAERGYLQRRLAG